MIVGHIGGGAIDGVNGGYEIEKSLRLRASASAYLSRTPGVAGDRTKWTFSAWVKRGALNGAQCLFSCNQGASTETQCTFFPSPDNSISILSQTSASIYAQKVSNQLFRDVAGFYHLVFVWDTNNATAGDRLRIYVNGVRVTSFAKSVDPALGATSYINVAGLHEIGAMLYGSQMYKFDGYIGHVAFVDGQALDATSFGQFHPITGQWIPKKYTGTYGTNGFYLDFKDGSSLTNLTADKSGNNNNWTANNISLTAGVTYDWMDDTPSNNFAVLNPLAKSTPGECKQGNLVYNSAGAPFSTVKASQLPTYKVYAEFVVPATKTWCRFGLVNDAQRIINGSGTEAIGRIGYPGSICYLASDGDIYIDNAVVASGATPATSDIVGLAYDPATGKVWFSLNGVWLNSGVPAAGTGQCATLSTSITWAIALTEAGSQDVFTNFGQRPFAYTPPAGFMALCTKNSPEPVIKNPKLQFDVLSYTGTGSTRSVTGALFQPDFVWAKNRTTASDHQLYDTVRGATNALFSNTAGTESLVAEGVTSFDSSGFSVGSSSINQNSNAIVSWLWKAGGSAVTNTAGSITSQVSANTIAGFSIVTYTGTGVDATVGHGLGVAPSMVIYKGRGNQSLNWIVYHRSISPTSFLELNTPSSSLSSTSFTVFGTAPTATTSNVLHVGRNINARNTNETGYNYVAYCFAEIPGFSRIGSYVGNGSADGPFVNLGFRPAFVIVKRTDATSDWAILDNKRNAANPVGLELDANLSQAEITPGWSYDFVSNGFKYRSATGLNVSGATYIYAAFAEAPFNYANAR